MVTEHQNNLCQRRKKTHFASVNFRGFFWLATLGISIYSGTLLYIVQQYTLFIVVYEYVPTLYYGICRKHRKSTYLGFLPFKKKLYGFNSNAVTKVHVNVFICTCITGRSLPYMTHTGPTLKLFHCLTQRHENFNQPLSVKTLI